jgi:hypothetical protein
VAPAHIVPGVAVGIELNAPPLIPIVIASVLEHPVTADVAVRVKIVVDVKFTVVGSSTVAFTSREAGVQLYVNGLAPVTVAFNVVLVPFGIVLSVPAFTTGSVFTVTVVAADNGL